jgi:hypothetical protein
MRKSGPLVNLSSTRRMGRFECAVDVVAKSPPQHRAKKSSPTGKKKGVRSYTDSDVYLDEYFGALDIVNNWRSSHSFPLNIFTVGLKRRAKGIDAQCIIAQRIKRMSSIELKLRRFPTMTKAQMQDLGGCRAVMSSVPAVNRLVKAYRVVTSSIRYKTATITSPNRKAQAIAASI